VRKLVLLGALALLFLSPVYASATDWPTFHGANTRQGDDTSDPGLADPVPAWTSPKLDGAVYAHPVIVGSQVVVATENNTVYSLDTSDGAVEWSTHLGTPRTTAITCGDINPQGITSTPVIDGGSVYVVANIQTGSSSFYFDLVSLSLSTGAVAWFQNIDPPDTSNPSGITWSDEALTMEDRGALLVTDGRVYVPMGGNDGDCGAYHGYVVSYPESGSGSLTWWASSEVDARDSQGADWSAGGLSEDAAGYIYAATGNSNQDSATDTYDYGDGVIKLDPNNLSPGAPVDYFAPSTWYQDNADDADFGSTAPLQLPNNRIFIVGKSGTGYLLNSTDLGHIGGQVAEHQVCHATADAAFGSLADANGTVFVGCSDGMAAVQIAGSNDDFSALWYNTTNVANHPPTVAGGLVWSVSSGGNQLLGFSASTGQLERTLSISGSTHFTTPSAANGQLYVGATDYVNAFGTGWHAPASLGATLGTGTAQPISWGPGNEEIFWRGTDNNLYQEYAINGTWYGPDQLTTSGNLASNPEPVSWGAGNLEVFWRGTDGNLWQMYYHLNGWQGPQSLGDGPLGSATPVPVSWGSGNIEVFWEGTDQGIWEAYYANGWQGPVGLGDGPLSAGNTPQPVSWGPGNIELFWEGTDQNLWEAYYANGWQGPVGLGDGPLGTGATLTPVSWGSGNLEVFWKGTDQNLWEAYYADGWHGPQGLGDGPLGSAPHPVASADGVLDAFWEGTDQGLWHGWYAGSWSGPATFGGVPMGDAAVVAPPQPLVGVPTNPAEVFWVGTDSRDNRNAR
jgi:outer membrane protein assembly factor BamB